MNIFQTKSVKVLQMKNKFISKIIKSLVLYSIFVKKVVDCVSYRIMGGWESFSKLASKYLKISWLFLFLYDLSEKHTPTINPPQIGLKLQFQVSSDGWLMGKLAQILRMKQDRTFFKVKLYSEE